MRSSTSNDKFVAFIERYNGVAMITVHPRPVGDRYGIDFRKTISEYETLGRGAMASARREIRKLSK